MALRNAFEDLAVETTQQEIRDLIAEVATVAAQEATTSAIEGLANYLLRGHSQSVASIPYARDPADRLRVISETGSVVTLAATTGNVGYVSVDGGVRGVYQSVYYGGLSQGAAASVDPREQLAEITKQGFLEKRKGWSFS